VSVIYRCDVCDEEFGQAAFDYFAEFLVPASWMPVRVDDDSDALHLDICSSACLLTLAKALSPESDESDGPEPDNEDEPSPGPWQQPTPDFDVTVR
jgi:hypothetical protein